MAFTFSNLVISSRLLMGPLSSWASQPSSGICSLCTFVWQQPGHGDGFHKLVSWLGHGGLQSPKKSPANGHSPRIRYSRLCLGQRPAWPADSPPDCCFPRQKQAAAWAGTSQTLSSDGSSLGRWLLPPPLSPVYKLPSQHPQHITTHSSKADSKLHLQLLHLCS